MSQYYQNPNQFSVPAEAVFIVHLPGYDHQPVSLPTLRAWASSKMIQGSTGVTDTRTGVVYQASNIPGVFSDKEYLVALLFSIFLGYWGIDRFYTGQVGQGIGKLLTGGGCGIWWLIDVVLYATRGVTDSNGAPLK